MEKENTSLTKEEVFKYIDSAPIEEIERTNISLSENFTELVTKVLCGVNSNFVELDFKSERIGVSGTFQFMDIADVLGVCLLENNCEQYIFVSKGDPKLYYTIASSVGKGSQFSYNSINHPKIVCKHTVEILAYARQIYLSL